MFLSDLKLNKPVIIKEIYLEGDIRKRFLDLGFIKGVEIEVVNKAPLRDPIIVKIKESRVAIRLADAKKIEVE